MTVRVKNLEKITRELLGQISTWEEHYGPFYYLVTLFLFLSLYF